MSAVLNAPRFADAQAYLAWEELQPERHEFVDGQVRPSTETTIGHNLINGNVMVALRTILRGTASKVYAIEVKLCIGVAADMVYPDVVVTDDPRDGPSNPAHYINHPWLIAEVLSDSTAAYDRGRKFELYRTLDTLTHYLLIEQTRPYAELFFRNEQGLWVLQPLQAGDMIPIERLGQPWPVASLFEGVNFTPASPPATPPPAP